MYDTTKPYTALILEAIRETWYPSTPYVEIDEFTGLSRQKHTFWRQGSVDGIGEGKGFYHWKAGTYHNAALDALAMNLNDLVRDRAEAYEMYNHIFLPDDDPVIVNQIIRCIAYEAKKRNIVIPNGETAIHTHSSELEISMTIIGLVRQPQLNILMPGDVLVGLRSNGLHSNGFTKVREIFAEDVLLPEFVDPTRIYSDELLPLLAIYPIHGMVHITGGGYTKILGLLKTQLSRQGIAATVAIPRNHSLAPQPIFQEIYRRGVSDQEMYKTFNCGAGFVVALPQEFSQRFIGEFARGEAAVIGEVFLASGESPYLLIDSKFSDQSLIYT